jgi:hypothetical protein
MQLEQGKNVPIDKHLKFRMGFRPELPNRVARRYIFIPTIQLFEGPRMEKVEIFYDNFEIFFCLLVCFSRFGTLRQEKSGIPFSKMS